MNHYRMGIGYIKPPSPVGLVDIFELGGNSVGIEKMQPFSWWTTCMCCCSNTV